MNVALRWAVVVVALGGLLLSVFSLTTSGGAPRLGIETVSDLNTSQFERIVNVVAGSAAERAGIRAGDRIRYATPRDEVAVTNHLPTAVQLVRSDGSVVRVVLAPVPRPLVRTLLIVQSLLISLLILLLAARAWTDSQARWLAVGFLWIALNWADSSLLGHWQAAYDTFGDAMLGIGMTGLVFFATGWSATPPRTAAALRWIAVAASIVFLVGRISIDFKLFFATSAGVIATIAWIVSALLMIAGLAATTGRAQGVERRRIGWLLATMTISFAPFVPYELLLAFGRAGGIWNWLAFPALVLPFGFGYAMLRHRVIDVGFVLNRAAVFAVTTALLVGLFGALQWGADQVLVRATGAQDFAVQMAIAVIVLYAIRALRTQADLVVARLFFGKRRRRIDAIGALGGAVEAVESAASLGPYVVEALRTEAAIEAALYVEADDAYGRVGGTLGMEYIARDNATIVALRATRAAVAVRGGGDLIGAIAFPLSVRGKLRGALVCALPSADEEYAPDEQAALSVLAARLCVVRDDLLAEQLRRERDELRGALVRLTGGSGGVLGRATAPGLPE